MAWDFQTDPEFQEHLDWMERFVRDEVWPIETIGDELDQAALDRVYAPLQRRIKERGLWAAHLDRELGGQGFGQVKLGLMHEILGTSPYAPNAFGCQAPDSGNSEALAMAGTAEQKERWLEPLLAGDLKSGFSMTEPHTAGSDPTLLQTRSVRDGDHYVIDGHKWFSSNGSIADFLIVMAVTDPEARAHERASMFIVDAQTPGVRIVRDVSTMQHPHEEFGRLGGHAEIVYEGVRVPTANRLGAEGEGFLISQKRLYPGRIHHCMRWLGVARRAFDMLCERATYREVSGGVLGNHETVQNWIADCAAQMQAARLMTLHAAWVMDTQGVSAARREISLVRFYGAGALHDRSTARCRLMVPSATRPICRSRRCTGTRGPRACVTGPTRSTAQSVGRQILRGYAPPADGVPSEHLPTRRPAARAKFAEILDAVTADE